MKRISSRSPFTLWLLSLSSVLLLAGFVAPRWPFEIPGASVGRLWLSNVLEPGLRWLSSSGGSSTSSAFSLIISWWPFVLGMALLLPVLGAMSRSDRPNYTWGFLIGLGLCLGGLRAVNVLYASSPSYALLALGMCLGVGAGISLASIGLGVAEGGTFALPHRLARTIRILLISAGIGIGSFVLLPLGSLTFALALAAIAFAYARAALTSRKIGRLSTAGQQDVAP